MTYKRQDKKSLPLLHALMKLKRVTNEQLAQKSGVSCRTVSEVRRGKEIKTGLADLLVETICSHL